MLLGIIIGIVLCLSYLTMKQICDKNILEYRQYFEYSSEATDAYNKISSYFIIYTDVLELKSLKFVNAYSPLNSSGQYIVIAKYKVLDKNFKVNFETNKN